MTGTRTIVLMVLLSSVFAQQSIEPITESIPTITTMTSVPVPAPTDQTTQQSTSHSTLDVINFTEPTSTTTTSFWTQQETTTTEQITTTPMQPLWMSETNYQYQIDSFVHCSCDMLINRCDVDCCCDADCSNDDRQLFSSCWTPPVSHFEHTYHCSSSANSFLAWNNTQTGATGPFCIVKDNTPKRRVYEEITPARREELIRQIQSKITQRWEDHKASTSSQVDSWIYEPFYKRGSPLFTFNQRGTLGIFKFPSSLNSASCNVLNRVNFLEQTSATCNIGDRCKPVVNFVELFGNVSVFRLPPRSVKIGGDLKWTDLVPIVIRICEGNATNCRTDLPIPKCLTGLESVTFRVGINGTQGIRYILADLLFQNGSAPVGVRFETVYQPMNGWVQVSRSGNPGYIQGKPLLATKFNSSAGVAEDDGRIQSLRLFDNSQSINFGEDIFQTARIDVQNRENRTEWCSRWTPFILQHFWSGQDISEWRLGIYGSAELNQTSLWLPIDVDSKQLTCFSRFVKAHLVIVYVKSGSYDQPQNTLLSASLHLRSHGSESVCQQITSNCSLLLTQTVSFVSAEATTSMILPVPPRWRIQLPHDFFYPFLMSSTASVSIEFFYYFIVVAVLTTFNNL